MNRAQFAIVLAAVPAIRLGPRLHNEIPVVVRGGRFFAVPRTTDGRTFRCWLDTDGSGFVFEDTVRSLRIRAAAAQR